ncbi:MAG: 30S ribosomal protein S12 methylthiotransferase RimO [Clostridia bacterium]|nr:30S ribosomal protein S12 methylthiotransferase RimO [Clostridia bacterium]
MKKTKIGFVSLGCPKNLLDTEVMLHKLASAGYELTPEETDADIIVINTCAFIESAKQEAIENILDIAWLKEHENLRGIVVTGCLVERYRDEVMTEIPEVDAVLGVGSIDRIVEAVRAVENNEKYKSYEDKEAIALGGDRVITTGDTMAYLKISEGCDNRCTYCAIPAIRGRFRSREEDDIIREAKELTSMGIRELVVIGQDTTAYGKDLYGEYRLPRLLRRLAEETDVHWLRILYCYPDKITDELIAELATNPKVVKYIDLPVQHVSDRVLRRMNRKGDGQVVRGAIERLRAGVPGITIRSTAIVGFPGETDEEFCELCEFVKWARFEHFGAFTYSREEGTPAYNLPDQIDEQVKQDRYDILMRMQASIHDEIAEEHVGQVVEVLCEGYDVVAETHYGRRAADAPEIDGKVYFSASKKQAPGTFLRVRVTEAMDYDLYGEMEE